MDLKVYEITSQRTLVGIPVESLSSESYQDATHRWLDVEGGSPEALREQKKQRKKQTKETRKETRHPRFIPRKKQDTHASSPRFINCPTSRGAI